MVPSSIGIHLLQFSIPRIRSSVSLGNPPDLQHISVLKNAEDASIKTKRLGSCWRMGNGSSTRKFLSKYRVWRYLRETNHFGNLVIDTCSFNFSRDGGGLERDSTWGRSGELSATIVKERKLFISPRETHNSSLFVLFIPPMYNFLKLVKLLSSFNRSSSGSTPESV